MPWRGPWPAERNERVLRLRHAQAAEACAALDLLGTPEALALQPKLRRAPKAWRKGRAQGPPRPLHSQQAWREDRVPPPPPELNPIEQAWSKVKDLLRSAEARTIDERNTAINTASNTAMGAVSASDAAGWFAHCGYFARAT